MGDSLKLTHPFPWALSNLKLNWEANTSLPTLDRLKREKILLETSMLSSAKKACFLNKKWLSLLALSQTCKQIINSTISHVGHGTNHNFDNETPSHFVAYSLRRPIMHNKILKSSLRELSTTNTWRKDYNLFPFHRVNKAKDCPLDCVPFLRASQRCKTKLLDRKHRKKERKKQKSKKSLNLQSGWVTPGGRCGGLVLHGISCCLALHVLSLSARSPDLFLSKPN